MTDVFKPYCTTLHRADMIRRRCASPSIIMWSRHSRRIEPMSRFTCSFCHGDRGAIGRSRMPSPRGDHAPLRGLTRMRQARCTASLLVVTKVALVSWPASFTMDESYIPAGD
jgi:hypothetical protein